MDLPPLNHPVWLRLASQTLPGFTPKQLALQLFLTRLKHDPASAAAKARMFYDFFVKYRAILTAEISQLHSL